MRSSTDMEEDPAGGSPPAGGFVRVRGAREHNLKNVDVEIPRSFVATYRYDRLRRCLARPRCLRVGSVTARGVDTLMCGDRLELPAIPEARAMGYVPQPLPVVPSYVPTERQQVRRRGAVEETVERDFEAAADAR